MTPTLYPNPSNKYLETSYHASLRTLSPVQAHPQLGLVPQKAESGLAHPVKILVYRFHVKFEMEFR